MEKTETNDERMLEVVVRLSALVLDLLKRVETLEKDAESGNVYLDGAPEYVKEYVLEKGGKV